MKFSMRARARACIIESIIIFRVSALARHCRGAPTFFPLRRGKRDRRRGSRENLRKTGKERETRAVARRSRSLALFALSLLLPASRTHRLPRIYSRLGLPSPPSGRHREFINVYTRGTRLSPSLPARFKIRCARSNIKIHEIRLFIISELFGARRFI